LLAQQIVTFLPRYEQLFNPGVTVGMRIRLYELLETFVALDNLIVNNGIKERKFCDFVMVRIYLIIKYLYRMITRDTIATLLCCFS
jgi:hypothetical protein